MPPSTKAESSPTCAPLASHQSLTIWKLTMTEQAVQVSSVRFGLDLQTLSTAGKRYSVEVEWSWNPPPIKVSLPPETRLNSIKAILLKINGYHLTWLNLSVVRFECGTQ